MTAIGADPPQLRDLATEMRRTRDQLHAARRRVASLVRSASWGGRDAEEFRRTWAQRQPRLIAVGDALTEASHELERNATDQERASGSDTFAGVSIRASAGRGGGDARWPPHGDPLALRSRSWTYGASAAAGVGARTGAAITAMDLPGPRSLVWEETGTGVLATAGAGAALGADDIAGAEVGLDAAAELGWIHREGTYVADSSVDGFVRSRVAQHVFADRGIASVMGAGLELIGLSAPSADIVDDLVALDVSAGAAASLVVGIAGAGAAGTQAIGTRRRGGATSLLFEWRGGAEAELGHEGPSGSVSASIEVQPALGDAQPVVISTSTVGGTRHDELVVLQVDRDRVADNVERALDELGRGRPGRAVQELEQILLAVHGEEVWVDSATSTVSTDDLALSAEVKLGPGIGVGLRGSRTVTEQQ